MLAFILQSSLARHPASAAALVAAALAALGPSPAAAQVRFDWADTTARIERYTTPEECLSLVWRLYRVHLEYGIVWRDTMPLTPAQAREPLPAPVVDKARACSARFTPAATPLTDYLAVTVLFLLAGRDDDAAALVERRLAAVAPKAEHERAAVLDTVVATYLVGAPTDGGSGATYLRVHPARLAMAEPRVKELAGLKAAPWRPRHNAHFAMLLAARDAADTTRLRWAAEGVIAAVASIPSAEQRTSEYSGFLRNSFLARELLAGDSLLDSLRRSTASYVALQQAHWAKTSGERPEALNLPIGRSAPPIEADFWLRRGDGAAPRPTKGKVALVAFLDHVGQLGEECANARCYVASAALHRVAAGFPDVEITLVTRTHGFFSAAEPPVPAAEADTLAHWWLEKHELPGALAVTATEFWRLPEPDRRRIDRDRPNELNYSFGRHWPVRPLSAYLIDRGGTIVAVLDLTNRQVDAELERLLRALLAQPMASR
jgi:hypothetical protein